MKHACLCWLLACCLLLASCAAPANSSRDVELAQPVHISIAFWNVGDELVGDPLQRYVEEKFNIVFDHVNVTYDNYTERLQQLSASDELPDILANDILGTSAYESWITQGKIRAIPKELTEYPLLEAYLDQPYNERFKRDNGSYYMIPRLTYSEESLWALDRCIMVRKDWLEKLDLSLPHSWGEFEALLRGFVQGDPDGNGKADTGGLVATHLNTLEAIYLPLFAELSNTERGWMYEDGQWMPSYCSKRTAPALEKVRQLYQEGLLAKEFVYLSTAEAIKAFANGKYGAICGQYYKVVNYMSDNGRQDEIADVVAILPTWPADDGNTYRFTTSLHWSESYFGANVSNEKMKLILSLYNWLLSDEFARIYEYGLEGVDWTWQAGKATPLGSVSPLRKYPSLALLAQLVEWRQDEGYVTNDYNILTYGAAQLRYAQEMLAWFREHAQRVNYNFDIVFMSLPSKNSLVYNSVVQDEMVKVIVGQESALTAWPAALQRLRETTTLSQAITDVTREAEREGIKP
ncbi:MAG: extracellular solute-binding protein [Clostridia bacterium]